MATQLKAIILDVDGTLFDRERAQREILRIMVRELSHIFAGIDEKTAVEAFLESDRISLPDFDAGVTVSESRARRSRIFLDILDLNEEFADEITRTYVERYPCVKAPISGAEPVVTELTEKFPLGVVSNGFPDVQYLKLKTLGIEYLFDCIVLSGELEIWKPDPRIFWKAATLLNKKPEECLYVGDSYEHDILGARAAGMMACWLNPHGLQPSQTDITPDFEISSLDELLDIARQI